jgi:hypothetical protein
MGNRQNSKISDIINSRLTEFFASFSVKAYWRINYFKGIELIGKYKVLGKQNL